MSSVFPTKIYGRRGLLAAATVLFSLTGFQATANAQNTAVLEEIVVTATKRAESLQDVPISIATLSGEGYDVLFAGGEDILALSGRVPGLYAESSNGRAAPRFYLRGLGNIDFDLAASQPVSIIMDDVVMENVVLKSFPLFDMEQVEVIRGPQGTLFGRNTTAGIIKFDSRRPTEETNGYATASYGTYGSSRVEGAIGGAMIPDVLTARFSALYQSRQDWINNGYTGEEEAMGNFQDMAARAQFEYTPTDDISIRLSHQFRSLDGTSSIFRANIFNTGSNSLNRNYRRDTVYYDGGDNNPQAYDSDGTTLHVDWDLGSTTLTYIGSRQNADGYSRGDIDGGVVDFSGTATVPPGISFDPAAPVFGFPTLTFPGTIMVPSVTQDSADAQQTTNEIRLASEDDGQFTWQIGAFFFDSELAITTDSFASYGFVDSADTIVVQNNSTSAVFGQGSYHMNDELTLTAGVRYTDDNKDFHVQQYGQLYVDLGIPTINEIKVSDNQISWDFSANYALNDKSSVYGRVSDGFRGQTIQGRDVAFLESPSVAKPETILSWEAGYKADLLEDRLRVNAAIFYYTVDDMQLSIIGGASNTNQVINAKEGVGSGFEVDFEYLVTDNLLIAGGFAYNKTEINDPTLSTATCGSGLCTVLDPLDENGRALLDGNPFPRAPETSYNISARYNIPAGSTGEYFVFTDWSVMGDVNMPLYEAVEFKTGTQFEGGLKIGYKNFENNWEVALFGRNITNEHNVKGFVDFSNNTGFVNDPPIVGIMGTYTFGE